LIAISKFDKSINMFKTDKVFSVEKSWIIITIVSN
jgi:hypothetical protein